MESNIKPLVYKVFWMENGSLFSIEAPDPKKKKFEIRTLEVAEDWLVSMGLGFFAFSNKDHAMEVCRGSGKKNLITYRCQTNKLWVATPENILAVEKNNPVHFKEGDVINNFEGWLGSFNRNGTIWCRDIYPISRVL